MAEAPPNLRYSDSAHDCSNCIAFKKQSQTCSMFNDWPVGSDLVCNAWQPADPEAVKTDGEQSEH